ncbi:MAG: hypothetical protein JO352_05510 [Chloroflexi bacterium]|nr:hypothetical protein [Chloroflexota bacterium]MBV9601345.1 hypothetical protein [Chloroflexota bacterium]
MLNRTLTQSDGDATAAATLNHGLLKLILQLDGFNPRHFQGFDAANVTAAFPAPPRVSVAPLFDGRDSLTLLERLKAALPSMIRCFPDGSVTVFRTSALHCGTREQGWTSLALDWNVSIVDPRGGGGGTRLADWAIEKLATHQPPRSLLQAPSGLAATPTPRLFSIAEGIRSDLIDSSTAYELTNATRGNSIQGQQGCQLETAALFPAQFASSLFGQSATFRDFGASHPLWGFRYGDDFHADRLIVILDGVTGLVVWSDILAT